MTVDELPTYWVEHGEAKLERNCSLASTSRSRCGEWQSRSAGGGVRTLGIPSVLDPVIQQRLLQALQPMFDPGFSQRSHGFRPGRNAHHAVCEAQRYIQDGKRVVVAVDLEKFFDCVNHDVLMGRPETRITDKRMLGLIRRSLEAGIRVNGVVRERDEGTPQGGPLAPVLANAP